MEKTFNSLPWHDAELLSLNIDRSNAGNTDTVVLKIKWPNGEENKIIFEDCYLLEAKMNFGIVALETIREAMCLVEGELSAEIKNNWKSLGVNLDALRCYRLNTNSTNSFINIYALSYRLT